MSIRMSVRAVIVLSAGFACAFQARAQAPEPDGPAIAPVLSPVRVISVSYRDVPAREAIADLSARARVRLSPIWSDSNDTIGLDPEARINLTLTRVRIETAIESVLRQCDRGLDATWQLADDGAIELGPRARLNRRAVTRAYDIHDLIISTPNFREAATLDLQAALQGSGKGAVLRENDASLEPRRTVDPGEDLLNLITETVEPEQWFLAGGTATIRLYNGQLIVHAAPYIHRQISGRSRASAE